MAPKEPTLAGGHCLASLLMTMMNGIGTLPRQNRLGADGTSRPVIRPEGMRPPAGIDFRDGDATVPPLFSP